MKKVALALINVVRCLRQYFWSYRITIQTDCPTAKILHQPELAR